MHSTFVCKAMPAQFYAKVHFYTDKQSDNLTLSCSASVVVRGPRLSQYLQFFSLQVSTVPGSQAYVPCSIIVCIVVIIIIIIIIIMIIIICIDNNIIMVLLYLLSVHYYHYKYYYCYYYYIIMSIITSIITIIIITIICTPMWN